MEFMTNNSGAHRIHLKVASRYLVRTTESSLYCLLVMQLLLPIREDEHKEKAHGPESQIGSMSDLVLKTSSGKWHVGLIYFIK